MYQGTFSALGAENIDRDYFESSVYRNLLDMLGILNNIRQELRAQMITVAAMPGRVYRVWDCDDDSASGTARAFLGPGKMALGHAIKLLGKDYAGDSWNRLMQQVPDNPWPMKLEFSPRWSFGEPTDPGWPSTSEVDRALMNARSLSMSMVNQFRNFEWELNRVHLPMVEDMRKAGLLLNDFVADLPTALPYHGERVCLDRIPEFDVEALDRGRLAAYKAAKMLRQMKTWLAEMTEKIKTRSEFDAAALERIAAEAAARAKAARQAEADAKAEAERQTGDEAAEDDRLYAGGSKEFDESARINLKDAQEAKKTAAKAAAVENQIISSDDVPDRGKGGGLLALAGGAAAFFFLS